MDGTAQLVHIRAMTQSLITLVIAMTFFVSSHFVMASLPVRAFVIGRIGETGHRALFSGVSIASLIWMLLSFGDARYDTIPLWDHSPALSMIPVLLLPITCILVVCSLTSRLPTAVGGERLAQEPRPTAGIMTITRHPMLVGFALWAIAHIPANGDTASVVLFGGILILCVGGMLHIDHRRRHMLGGAWGPIALTTAVIPFQAAIQGRTSVDWAGIGLWRVALGLVLYGILLYAHPWIAGVAVLPH